MNSNEENDEESQPLVLTDKQIQQLSSKIFNNQDPSEWVRRQLKVLVKSDQQANENTATTAARTIVTGTFYPDDDVGAQQPSNDNLEDLSLLSFGTCVVDGHRDTRDATDAAAEGKATDNIDDTPPEGEAGVSLQMMSTRVRALEEENQLVSTRVRALEEENRALRDTVATMEADMNEKITELGQQASSGQQLQVQPNGQSYSRMRGTILFRSFTFKRGLDEDTFSLMMISSPNSQAWYLGLTAFAFQITLGLMIAWDQMKEGDGSSIFNVPFTVDPVVRVGQCLTIILCLATQSDVLSAIQCFILMKKDDNWHEVIDIEHPDLLCPCGAASWYTRIALPNSLKLTQGVIVIIISFVIIVQSDDIIDLLKDFSALMVLSETDNILFQLADMGFLGKYLQNKAAKVKEIEIEDEGEDNIDLSITHEEGMSSIVRTLAKGSKAFRIRSISLLLLFAAILMCWIGIVIRQENGFYFEKRYPNCTSTNKTIDMFRLAKENFGDDICYGGPLNTLGCKFEGGDCVDFNLAHPLCKGDENLTDVQKKVENGICDLEMNTEECNYDASQCCPLNVTSSPSFEDGACNGGASNTKLCHYDSGDCNTFVRDFPLCPLNDIAKIERSSDVILGNDICEGGIYTNDLCGWEYRDCDAGQIGQDVIIRGASSPKTNDTFYSLRDLFFKSRMSADGLKLVIGMYSTAANDTFDILSPGKVKLFGHDQDTKLWTKSGNDLMGEQESEGFGWSCAMSGNGNHIVIGSLNSTRVKVYHFNTLQSGWMQLGQDIMGPEHVAMDLARSVVGMNHDGSRIVICSSDRSSLNSEVEYAGSIQVFDINTSEQIWERVGQEIYGDTYESIGFSYVLLDSLGTRVYVSTGLPAADNSALRVYEYKELNDEWIRLGQDIQTPYTQEVKESITSGPPAISGDGNRIAVFSADSPRHGKVQVYDLDMSANDTQWKEVGAPIVSEERERGNGFRYSIDMSEDGTLLAISSFDSRCFWSLGRCSTGSVDLYRYHPTNPPYRQFSRVPRKKLDDFSNVMEGATEGENDEIIFGMEISLSKDGSKISVSGYDFKGDSGFVKVYEVDDLFYPDCIVSSPHWIGDKVCDEYEPYFTEQCGYDGGDCPKPSPVDGYPGCYVSYPDKIGDGTCNDYFPYNSEHCTYDGGDCGKPVQVEKFPYCYVSDPRQIVSDPTQILSDPTQIVDGLSCWDRLPYNSIECGFVGGACEPKECDDLLCRIFGSSEVSHFRPS